MITSFEEGKVYGCNNCHLAFTCIESPVMHRDQTHNTVRGRQVKDCPNCGCQLIEGKSHYGS